MRTHDELESMIVAAYDCDCAHEAEALEAELKTLGPRPEVYVGKPLTDKEISEMQDFWVSTSSILGSEGNGK